MWDKKFAGDEYLYGKEPNVFIAQIIDTLPASSHILFLGEGEGRNACYAAKKSHRVQAIDSSEVALNKLDKLAKECDVKIASSHLDLKDWHADEQYDAILCSYLHLEEPLRTEVFVKALNALRLGGVFAGEFFATTQLGKKSGGPKDESLLYKINDFKKLARPGYICKNVQKTNTVLDEGEGHKGDADVIRVEFLRSEELSRVPLEKLTLKALFDRSTDHYRDNTALKNLDGSIELTYGDFALNVAELQRVMIEHNIGANSRVALCSENMPNWGVVYFAVTTMGAVIVPILPDFNADEIRRIILHAECEAVFISKRLQEALEHDSMRDLELSILSDDLSIRQAKEHNKNIDKIKSMVKKESRKATDIYEDDLCAIIYTSGTTGNSKGVMLTHRALAFQAVSTDSIATMTQNDRFLSILPLAHTYECSIGFLAPFANGSSITYIDKVPTPKVLIAAMSQVKPTFMLSVPLVIEKIFKNRIQPNFSKNIIISTLYKIPFVRKKLHKIAGKKLKQTFGGSLKLFGIGGAPLSPSVESFLLEAEFPYCIGYGLTETAPLIAGSAPFHTKLSSIGRVLDGVEIKIVECNTQGEGAIHARGPNIMLGYYKAPEKTAEILDAEGWFNTEDLGYIDEDGYLFISGRSKNVIIGASGENIYPEHIEAIIGAEKFVEDSLVYHLEGQLVARIYLDYEKLDQQINIKKLTEREAQAKVEHILEQIRTNTNNQVSKFSKISRVIEQREPFIKTATKKIKRYLYVS